MNVFVFDIETVPDVDGGRRLHNLPDDLPDTAVAEILFQKRRQESGGEFLRPHLQRIAAISVVWRSGERCKVWSLGNPDSPERELIERFFDGLTRYTPTLVSWNGTGFDLPVLHYRALLHGISIPRYWDTGDEDNSFRWNNYLNRFHWRHIDLMDVLSGYQSRAAAPLTEIATLLGLPGKMGMHGAKVWDSFQAGDMAAIRNYCETDVLNTYLIYLRFELMRGKLQQADYQRDCQTLRDELSAANKPHLSEFLSAWTSI
ncbi:MAG: 3'-5' exonuclease [Candidatus Competibacteraceae bacterium]|jgi:predicted PolB exonuclease-like 3'-5' exonuclease|nr:3'-5' exonuclease [Candidatus Competibacteraceae bacterium]